MNRRKLLHGLAAGAGAALGSSVFPGNVFGAASPATAAGSSAGANAAPAVAGSAKRVIFFLQNQGFDPATCVPEGMKQSGSLAKAKLPEPIEALEPYKERLHIINGLHGKHTSPSHSAFFGALGGYRGSDGVPPSGPRSTTN